MTSLDRFRTVLVGDGGAAAVKFVEEFAGAATAEDTSVTMAAMSVTNIFFTTSTFLRALLSHTLHKRCISSCQNIKSLH